MRVLRVLLSLIIFLGQVYLFIPPVFANESSNVVIAQMYPGTSTGEFAKEEYVEIYNNASAPIDVTGWCIEYLASSGNMQWNACLEAPDATTKLFLPPQGYATFVSNELHTRIPTVADAYFDGGIYLVKGYLRLVNAQGVEMDRLGWGEVDDELYPAAQKPADGSALQREKEGDIMQDTDNDNRDFIETDVLIIHASNVYEEEVFIDACPNIADIQLEMPEGFLTDENGDCQVDSCLNIEGLQVSVPDGYDSDEAGNCVLHDECDNLEGAQGEIPELMVRGDGNDCIIEYSPLVLNEILPNAIGSDDGNEFVEIYNPSDSAVDLTFYILKVGDTDAVYSFPVGATIGPGEYRTFNDSQMKFTLVNSSGRVILTAIGGSVFGDTGVYESAAEGESWALIDSTWQYTNRPTPNAQNMVSVVTEAPNDSSSSELKPCNPDQYRNPETNRCKKYETTSLKPCKEGQYRSTETNRCRNVTSASTLTPCKEGQYRNPETNRCRKIASTSSLKPCDEDQYRNPETNRCRKKESISVPEADYAVKGVDDGPEAFTGWWALGGVGVLAAGYAGWEWRREITRFGQRFFRLFKK
jgi:hypothetical protein